MFRLSVSVFIIFLSYGRCGVIIPEELPSLLSVAYSNIPPIKKGTDSRVGFGFAFGNHADFQVVFELGPQTNTNPIGEPFPANTKRHVPAPNKINRNREKFLQSEAGQYLAKWAQQMRNPTQFEQLQEEEINNPKPGEVPNLEESMVELVKNQKGLYEIHQPAPVNIPKGAFNQLTRLYGDDAKQNLSNEVLESKIQQKNRERSAEEVKKITQDLSNVDLD